MTERPAVDRACSRSLASPEAPLFYVDVAMPAGRELPLPREHAERAA